MKGTHHQPSNYNHLRSNSGSNYGQNNSGYGQGSLLTRKAGPGNMASQQMSSQVNQNKLHQQSLTVSGTNNSQ
jgi:hypothetical protein